MHGLLRRLRELSVPARVEDWVFGRDMSERDYEPSVELEVVAAGELLAFRLAPRTAPSDASGTGGRVTGRRPRPPVAKR